jgi:KUP system potassium uptake protein
MPAPIHNTQHQKSAAAMLIGALGVVYGDIGTSPLYTLRESFVQSGLPIAADTVWGFLSLIFWTLSLVVSLKYASFLLRINNRGEGGIMALAALILSGIGISNRLRWVVASLAILGIALFYGDGIITPAISVLSAVEGLKIVSPDLADWVMPLSLGILVLLFLLQRFGTHGIGQIAGPITLVWFITLAVLGIGPIADNPSVLWALNPYYALTFLYAHAALALVIMGAVVLCVTGAEALYSDLGHFGRLPIQRGWFFIVYPALILNYFGQGALLLANPAALENPFYMLAPAWALWPLIGLATFATIIASQAVITGSFSLTRQAIQLGYLPRMRVIHTDQSQIGQVYIPEVNWMLLMGVVLLVLGFGDSSSLAGMYGVAVTGTMLIVSILIVFVMRFLLRKSWAFTMLVAGGFIVIDILLFSSTLLKFSHGGWVSLLLAGLVFAVMSSWVAGRKFLTRKRRAESMPLSTFIETLRGQDKIRAPGCAVYMAYLEDVVPYPLLYNWRHNHALHEKIILLTVRTEDRPVVPENERLILGEEEMGIWHLVVRTGFAESPRLLHSLGVASRMGLDLHIAETTFFLGRDRIFVSKKPPLARWRAHIFTWLANHNVPASDFYHLPHHRVIELGAHVEL